MTVFSLFAALLVGLVLAFILPGLLGRGRVPELDRDAQNVSIARDRLSELERDLEAGAITRQEFDEGRADLEDALAVDLGEQAAVAGSGRPNRFLALGLALSIPVAAVLLYRVIGMPGALDVTGPGEPKRAEAQTQHTARTGPDGQPMPPVEKLVEQLAAKLRESPDNAEGWMLLGRTYGVMERWSDAADAYGRAHQLLGDDPDLLVTLAEAVGNMQNGSFTGRPEALLKRAMELDPENPRVLWFNAWAAVDRQDYAGGARLFRKLWPMVQDDPRAAEELRKQILALEKEAGVESAPLEIAGAPTSPDQDGNRITVSVSLDPALAAQAAPGDTVFIFARALQGPPMPLAVVRKQVRDLPITVSLDDSMAMMPRMKLSNFAQVRVGARVSKSGNAMPQSGDLTGELSPVELGDQVAINIDSRKP
ncbi:MAG: c-type cytochrome biogenesis protein CcmI [Gammaproteobacteria bacterium]